MRDTAVGIRFAYLCWTGFLGLHYTWVEAGLQGLDISDSKVAQPLQGRQQSSWRTPVLNPSSNSIVPVAWIIEPDTYSLMKKNCYVQLSYKYFFDWVVKYSHILIRKLEKGSIKNLRKSLWYSMYMIAYSVDAAAILEILCWVENKGYIRKITF